MKARCYNTNAHNYKYYGEKGVKVCAEWLESFDNFFKAMGYRPKGHTIGRKNDVGNYEPSNCEWQSKSQQSAQAFRGEKNRHSKLTEEQVLCIRSLWECRGKKDKLKACYIAKELNISKQSVNNILSKRTWTHI